MDWSWAYSTASLFFHTTPTFAISFPVCVWNPENCMLSVQGHACEYKCIANSYYTHWPQPQRAAWLRLWASSNMCFQCSVMLWEILLVSLGVGSVAPFFSVCSKRIAALGWLKKGLCAATIWYTETIQRCHSSQNLIPKYIFFLLNSCLKPECLLWMLSGSCSVIICFFIVNPKSFNVNVCQLGIIKTLMSEPGRPCLLD